MARKLIPDPIKCQYCEAALTNEELRNIAEAEGITRDDIELNHIEVELMCDKCAEGA